MYIIINNVTKADWSDVMFPFYGKREGIYGYYVLTHDLKMFFFYSGSESLGYEDASSDFTITSNNEELDFLKQVLPN